ncbi:MAG: hypothetical protein ACXACB_10460 [Promethearchaeota archaeon]
MRRSIPEYTIRDRKMYISQKLLEITEKFRLEMPFYFLSKKVLYRLWETIKNTTDNVIAGLCASITALCSYRDQINVSNICNLLDIKMSTIQSQVKRRIFEKFKVPGFKSLVKSSNLLKEFLKKLNLLELDDSVISNSSGEDSCKKIKVELGNSCQVYNPLRDHYLFDISSANGTRTLGYLKTNKNSPHIRLNQKSQFISDIWFDLALGEYSPSKGPPISKRN